MATFDISVWGYDCTNLLFSMKILFLNTGYCTGILGKKSHYLTKSGRYFYNGNEVFQKLILFVKKINPDILGVAEIDKKSFRSRFVNHVKTLAENCQFETIVYDSKYGKRSLIRKIPIIKNHCNAILAKGKNIPHKKYFLKNGMKKLVLKLEINKKIDLYIIHLSLGRKSRKKQLEDLENLIRNSKKEVIIAGDFNTLQGSFELNDFMQKNNLHSVNKKNAPTFPSIKPKKELDFFLISKGIKVEKFRILKEQLSDHLPILLEVY